MAKGKTNQPVTVEVWPNWIDHPAVKELKAADHVVRMYGSDETGRDPDLILHPAAGWHEALFEQFHRKDGTPYRPYLDARVKWARANKRRTPTK